MIRQRLDFTLRSLIFRFMDVFICFAQYIIFVLSLKVDFLLSYSSQLFLFDLILVIFILLVSGVSGVSGVFGSSCFRCFRCGKSFRILTPLFLKNSQALSLQKRSWSTLITSAKAKSHFSILVVACLHPIAVA